MAINVTGCLPSTSFPKPFEPSVTLARALEEAVPGLLVPVGIDATDPLAELSPPVHVELR